MIFLVCFPPSYSLLLFSFPHLFFYLNYAANILVVFCRVSILDHMKHYTHLLVSIPPIGGIGDPVWYQYHFFPSVPNWFSIWLLSLSKSLFHFYYTDLQMLQHERLLRSSLVNGNLRWLCYLSSTSMSSTSLNSLNCLIIFVSSSI